MIVLQLLLCFPIVTAFIQPSPTRRRNRFSITSLSSTKSFDEATGNDLLTEKIVDKIETESISKSSDGAAVGDLFTEKIIDKIVAESKSKLMFLSFVPDSFLDFTVSSVIEEVVSSGLTGESLIELRSILDKEDTSTSLDDASKATKDALSKKIASEINIDIPFFSGDQEKEILESVVSSMLQVLTTSESEKKKRRLRRLTSILKGKNTEQLVKKINDDFDIPIITEAQEKKIFTNAVESLAKGFKMLIPEEVMKDLRDNGSVGMGIEEFKSHLVSRLKELIFLPESIEDRIVVYVVDTMVDDLIGDTAAEFILMTPDEQRQELKDRIRYIEDQMVLSTHKYQQEQSDLKVKLQQFEKRLEKMEASMLP